VKEAMDYIKDARPHSSLLGVGVSLGANVLANVSFTFEFLIHE
jgi:predicted alpha/beta-fold hydrolase